MPDPKSSTTRHQLDDANAADFETVGTCNAYREMVDKEWRQDHLPDEEGVDLTSVAPEMGLNFIWPFWHPYQYYES